MTHYVTGPCARGVWGVRRPRQPKMYQKGPHCLHIKQKQVRLLFKLYIILVSWFKRISWKWLLPEVRLYG